MYNYTHTHTYTHVCIMRVGTKVGDRGWVTSGSYDVYARHQLFVFGFLGVVAVAAVIAVVVVVVAGVAEGKANGEVAIFGR
jgi:uncharacterized membrane-anchored protein